MTNQQNNRVSPDRSGAAQAVPDAVGFSSDAQRKERTERKTPADRARSWWTSLPYTARATAAFALIAVMTALVAVGVLSFVWSGHFNSYTKENMKSLADSMAESIEEIYAETGTLKDPEVRAVAEYAQTMSRGIGILVTETGTGNVIYDTAQVEAQQQDQGESKASSETSSRFSFKNVLGAFVPSGETGVHESDRAEQGEGSAASLIALKGEFQSAPIMHEGKTVGNVRVWVYGSEVLLTQADQEFRDNSYRAMLIATGIAAVLASCIGFLFARSLVAPINRLTHTARRIKEGDLKARTGLKGEDEVSRLGETFDEMAEAVERDRELERRLTTDVAHELRTPLMAIQSTVEAMVDGVFEPNEERLETVNSEVQRLSRLVDAILKLSRLENRSKPLNQERINVGELIEGIISVHEAFVVDSGLNMVYQAEPDVMVDGDADLIRQAVANLISNAVRYTPEGGTITVSVYREDASACIRVADTGIGLSPEEARMVFSRFWRADAGRNRESGGLGVGLSVVREIVDRHNGTVKAEGEKGKGALFTISLPLAEEPKKSKKKSKSKGKNKKKSNAAHR